MKYTGTRRTGGIESVSEAVMETTLMEDLIDEARRIANAEDETAGERLSYRDVSAYALGDRYQIQSTSITHEMIIDWLIANPGFGQMGKCAQHFGCTRPWLSTLVHSDAFQAKLRDRKEEVFETTIVPLRDKIVGVANRAVEKLGEAIEETEDPRMLLDTADKMLHKLGYAPKTVINPAAPAGVVNNTQNNFYPVTPELLAAAREKTKKGDLHATTLPSPEGVSGEPQHNVGETGTEPSAVLISETEESQGGETTGD
jgi:hypothetical protein